MLDEVWDYVSGVLFWLADDVRRWVMDDFWLRACVCAGLVVCMTFGLGWFTFRVAEWLMGPMDEW